MPDDPDINGRARPARGTIPPNYEQLWTALQDANIPTLLMVVAQLTGEPRWLQPPYAPTRTRGMDDNSSGGLPESIQQEIRRAAYDVLVDDTAAMGDIPSASMLASMASITMGEEVPAEYGEMMLEEMGLSPRAAPWPGEPDAHRVDAFRVAIIGAGVSGICAAIELRRAGINAVVFEKSPEIGGTWLDNRYPGCGVDTPSHLYSYSFAPRNWSRYFAKQEEIHAYLADCVDGFGVRDAIQLSTEVLSADFQDATGCWTITTRGPSGSTRQESFNAVISAVGQLNEPAYPAIPGADRFRGTIVHSARWTPDIEVSGRRIAVIGSGATAMQLVPAVAGVADHVTVFQRSPQWASPSANYALEVPAGVRYLMTHVPLYAAWYRCRLVWSFSDKVHASLQKDPDWPGDGASINAANDGHRRFFTRYLTEELGERSDLLPKVLPTYPPFAKRMLIDNGWFRTVTRPDVDLVDTGVRELTEEGVLDGDGQLHPADIVVYATGFMTLRMIGSFDVRGRGGRSLREEWGDDDARAYLGVAVHGFPNFFCLYGPNTSLGHGGSVIFLTECATRYIVGLLQRMIIDAADTIEVRPEVVDEYNRRVDEAHEHMIWTHPGTNNWYRNARGRVVTNSPWPLVDYWHMTRSPDPADYDILRCAEQLDAIGGQL